MSAESLSGGPGNAHLTEKIMQGYQERKLAGNEMQAADRHLSGCGRCRRVLLARVGMVRLPEEVVEMPEPLHLSYAQITAYVDGALAGADKERFEAHTFLCSSCSREIADLKRLDAQLTLQPVEAKKAAAPKASVADRIARFLAAPGRAREFGLAFGAIVAGFFMLFQAGRMTGAGSEGGSHAARLVQLGADAHPGLNLGGFLLLTTGVGYIAYSLWKKR